jgi:membrane protease YdiL (CAAX protease family)
LKSNADHKHTRASNFPGNVNQIETPPSPSVPSKRVPGIAQAIALNALYIGVVTVVTIALYLLSRFTGVSLDLCSYALVQQIVAWPITLWVGLRWSEASFLEACRLTRFPVRIVPALFIAFFGLTILAVAGWSLIPMPEVLQKFVAQAVAERSRPAFFLSIVLGAPVGEELFFRGLVLRGFLGRYSVTKAVWASALLWAVSHLNPWQAVGALPLGLVLGWLVVRTGSLIPAIIGHMIANFSPNYLFPPLALALGHDAKDLMALELGHFPPAMLAIGGAMAGIGGFVLWRQIAKLPNDENA